MKNSLKTFPKIEQLDYSTFGYNTKEVTEWKEAIEKELQEELEIAILNYETVRGLNSKYWSSRRDFIKEILGDVEEQKE